ncbi:MAG: type I-E CRISPR-associated protein Cas6/Cse3/CasE, partial [Bacteroidota bacterium]
FSLAMDSVTDAPFQLGRKRKLKPASEIDIIAKERLGHFGVRFDGVLRVDNSVKVLDALRQGIGPAKAFGFGLLSLAPVKR